jgi:hypothetical protein
VKYIASLVLGTALSGYHVLRDGGNWKEFVVFAAINSAAISGLMYFA